MNDHKMSTIGVAGVTIPGTLDCIHKINLLSSLQFSNNAHPNLILYQPNFAIMQSALQKKDWDQVLFELSKSIEVLAKSGADFVIIPANSVHKVITQLQKQSSIPILNILEVVCEECFERNIKKLGVLGTVWTMSDHLYKEVLENRGIEEITPSAKEQLVIQDAIFKELIPTGQLRPQTLQSLLEIVESLKQRGCDGIALACTELPLALNERNCGIPVIDSTKALAKAALKKSTEHLIQVSSQHICPKENNEEICDLLLGDDHSD